jgi:hypothetical protein
MQDSTAQHSSLRSFIDEIHDFTLSMPSTKSAPGRVSKWATGHSAIDYDRYTAFKQGFPSGDSLTAFVQEIAERGGGSSGVGDKLGKGIYSTESLMGTYPGMGTQEYVRKFSTVMNFLPLGNEAGPGEGVTALVSTTPRAEELTKELIENLSTETIGSSSGLSAKANIVGAASNFHVVKMAQYTGAESLAGGAFAIRPGAFEGIYSYLPKEIAFKPEQLPSASYLDRLIPGSTIDPDVIDTLKSINLEKDAEFQALLNAGMTRGAALRKLGQKDPKAVNIVQSVVKEPGGSYRLFYGQREAIGPGTKLSLALRKGLAAYIPSAFRGLAENVDIALSPLTSKERGRQLVPIYQAAEIFLTNKQFVSPAERLANAQKIAEALNQANILKGIQSRVKAENGRIIMPNDLAITSSHIESVSKLLPTHQQETINKLLGGVSTPFPIYAGVLPQGELASSGRVINASIQDVMGLRMEGMDAHADAILRRMGKSKTGNELRNIFQYLHNKSAIPGSELLPPSAVADAAKHVSIKFGALEGIGGSTLFDPSIPKPLRGVTKMLDLGHAVKLKLGPDRAEEVFTQLPIMSLDARKMSKMPSGTVWAGDVNRALIDLLQAVNKGEGTGVQLASQKYIGALAGLAGDDKTIVSDVLKTRLSGVRGTMAFLNEDAEAVIRSKYGISGTGFVGMTMDRAKEFFAQGYGIRSQRKIQEMVRSGVYVNALRHPAAPRGWASGRLVLMTPDILQHSDFGKDVIYTSAGLGTHIHGDLDQDTINIETQFQRDAAVQAETKRIYIRDQNAYEFAKQQAIKKLKAEGSPVDLANQESLANIETMMGNVFKGRNTGIAHNAAFRIYDGAIALGKSTERVGHQRYTKDYAKNLGNVLFALGEESINTKQKQSGAMIDIDIQKALYGGTIGDRSTKLQPMVSDYIEKFFGPEANKKQITDDILESLGRGRTSVISNIQGMNREGNTVQDIINAILPQKSTIVPEGLSGQMADEGILRATEGIGIQNRTLAEAANDTKATAKGVFRESIENYARGLREGKGWSSLLIGGAVLGGIGLSMRKPGNIIVVGNAQRNGEQQAPNGNYVRTNETNPVVPRKERSVRVMQEKQYNVRVRIKEAQRQDKKRFVDLANAISGKYKQPAQANINIRDDSSEQDYGRIFRKEFQRQHSLGAA